MRNLILLISLLLASCSTIDYSRRVEGWPVLRQEIRYVSQSDMRRQCDRYASWLEIPIGCVEFLPDDATCRIWIVVGNEWTLPHERAHCDGYDHLGSDVMQRMFDNWRNK